MVRISVRLSEEENEKLRQNSALCELTQSEYVRQLCKGIHSKPKPPDAFWELMNELYRVHSALRLCKFLMVGPTNADRCINFMLCKRNSKPFEFNGRADQ